MADDPRRTLIGAHIMSITTRSSIDADRLTSAINERYWPGGSSDSANPGALGWVRRWRPSRGHPVPSACACALGACSICN